jgi:tRNA(adenine34) deaminase
VFLILPECGRHGYSEKAKRHDAAHLVRLIKPMAVCKANCRWTKHWFTDAFVFSAHRFESGGAPPHSKTQAMFMLQRTRFWECGSALPLFHRRFPPPVDLTRTASMDSAIDIGSDQPFMREALRQAAKAREADEVPIGAVVVRNGTVIARAYNQVELLKDATAHAEMLALTQAEAAVGDWRLVDCDLYVTKEPCVMCAGAIVHVRLRRLIFGCADPRGGGAGGIVNLLQHPTLNHQCAITSGILETECAAILQDFFRRQRNLKSDL